MKSSDLPEIERTRAYVADLYAAVGKRPDPLRLVWDITMKRKERAAWCRTARLPGVFFRCDQKWDELEPRARERLREIWTRTAGL